MIHSLILDLDGPILDGKYRHYQCYFDILTELGYVPIPIDSYWDMKRRRADRHILLAASGADTCYDLFLRSWLERIEQKQYLNLDRLQPGSVEKLQEWKAAGKRMFLVTLRNNLEHVDWQLDSLGLVSFFDKILVCGHAGGSTGKAESVRPLLTQTELRSTLWIGDTEIDLQAARTLDVPICLVSCGLRLRDYLETLSPNMVYSDIAAIDLAEARWA